MPTITLNDGTTFEANADQRLVLALTDRGIDILHRCGGHAQCTTCRVTITDGEPTRMTVAERERLQAALLYGKVRLSCQILCDHAMTVEPIYRVSLGHADSPGDRPKDQIEPSPTWINK
jgi:ferredoxin